MVRTEKAESHDQGNVFTNVNYTDAESVKNHIE